MMKRLWFLPVLWLLCGISCLAAELPEPANLPESAKPATSAGLLKSAEQPEPAELTEPVMRESVTISFAGDFTLGNFNGQGYAGTFNEYLDRFGTEYFLENVKPVFESDDITFVNLEGALTNHQATAQKKFPIKGNAACAKMLADASVEVCNLSNNHIWDCGQAGVDECLRLLNDEGVKYCGEGISCMVEQNGFQVGFLGYQAWGSSAALKSKISGDIQELKAQGAEIICVMFHYGIEYDYYPYNVQKDISRYTIDAGADIVLGGHPHVLQGVEKYHDRVICYSLGNFCFGANQNPRDKDTMIFRQTFIKDEGMAELGESVVVPCSISSVSNRNDFKPTVKYFDEGTRIIDRLKTMSSVFGDTIDMLK